MHLNNDADPGIGGMLAALQVSSGVAAPDGELVAYTVIHRVGELVMVSQISSPAPGRPWRTWSRSAKSA